MTNSSQSRHFTLHWLDRPQAWLDQLDHFGSTWSWLVSHHQLLTLAKRAERQVGLSILWFSVSDESKKPLALGALLPGERLALIARSDLQMTSSETEAFQRFLKTKTGIASVMGTHSDLRGLGFVETSINPNRIIEHQMSWGKRLTQNASALPSPSLLSPAAPLHSRRANETDRALLGRWAKVFASETDATTEGTLLEVGEWMKRGRLLVFETSRPVGMAALSGEYTDRVLGRSCRLSLLFVDPLHRGRGIGRLVVDAIEQEARLENASGLVLYSDASNARIKTFYSDLGFTLSDEWLEVEAGLNVKTTG